MLEDVVEHDDVIASSWRQRARKKTNRYIVAFARSQSADRRIRLNAVDFIAPLCCRVEKPAMRAAYFEQGSPGRVCHRVDPIEDPLEIFLSQADNRNLPLFLVDDVGKLPIADMRTQVRGKEPAHGASETPFVAQRTHVGIANGT